MRVLFVAAVLASASGLLAGCEATLCTVNNTLGGDHPTCVDWAPLEPPHERVIEFKHRFETAERD